MRAVRILAAACALLLAVAVAAAWIVPGLLAWDNYRGTIESAASASLGRPVRISGPIGLTLLPQPVLTASGVSVAEAGDGISMSAGRLRLQVAFGPLLAGRLEARAVFLQQASLQLPWPLPPGTLTRHPPARLHGFQAHIEDSRVRVGQFELSSVDGDLAADGVSGALSASGAVHALGQSWQVTARVGNSGSDGTATLEGSLDGQGVVRDTGGSFSGQVTPDGDVAGRVKGRGRDLSLLITAPSTAWHAEGRLSASGGLILANDLALDIGGAPARGAVALRLLPAVRLDAAIAASQLDLDIWLPRLLQQAPAGIPTGIDLSAEAASLAGGTLRHVRAAFEAGLDGVLVRDADIVLPGDAALHLAGRVRDRVFEGTAKLDAANLRPALRWLRQAVPALTGALPDALAQASFKADLRAGPDSISMKNLVGMLNDAAAGGSATLSFGPRPAMAVRMTLDGLTLDPWFGVFPASSSELARDLAGAPSDKGFDADLKLELPHATWMGRRFDTLTLDGRTARDTFELRRMQAAGAGFRLSASGQVGAEGRVSNGVGDFAAADAALLAGVFPIGDAMLHGPAMLHATFSGPPNALGVVADAAIEDLRAGVDIRLDLPVAHVSGQVSLRHPGAVRLARAFGLAVPWVGDGSLSLLAQVDAAPGKIKLDQAVLTAGVLRAAFGATLDCSGVRPVLSGAVDAETLPLPRPLPGSREPLPLDWLRGFDAALHVRAAEILAGLEPALNHAEADVTLKEGLVSVRKLTAMLSNGQVSGDATLDTGQTPPVLALAGRLAGFPVEGPLFGTPFDITAGRISAAANLTATGYSPSALLSTTAGTASAAMEDGALSGFDLDAVTAALSMPDAEAAVRRALSGGVTQFTALNADAKLARGAAALGPVRIRLADGTASAQGTADLTGGLLFLQVTADPAPGLPAVSVRLDGPAVNPRRTADLAQLARWLAERAPSQ
jgi:hypothetical protein